MGSRDHGRPESSERQPEVRNPTPPGTTPSPGGRPPGNRVRRQRVFQASLGELRDVYLFGSIMGLVGASILYPLSPHIESLLWATGLWGWMPVGLFPPAGSVLAIALGMWALPTFLRIMRVTELRRPTQERERPSATDQ